MSFQPDLSILPPEQLALWPKLSAVPEHYVLYGGTAIALRLGHRQSVDFDFFTNEPFSPDQLVREMPFLGHGQRLQSQPNTLTVSLVGEESVGVSFLGDLKLGRVGVPQQCRDNGIWIADLLDLAATKMAAVQNRAEKKDYLDVYTLVKNGISLERALGAAAGVYGAQFNPAITLKALAYFQDGDLPTLPIEVQEFLQQQAAQVKAIEPLPRTSDSLSVSGG